jgi:hypothetical protein
MEKTNPSRQYPPIYEKMLPLALWGIGIIGVILLVITVAVALRLIGAA